MAEEAPPPTSQIQTYHCLCTTLVLTTAHQLQSLPRRATPIQDAALILPPPFDIAQVDEGSVEWIQPVKSVFLNVLADRKPIIIRREDGFERRTLVRCGRCKLVLGYHLDDANFDNSETRSNPMYLLPGGMSSTADMANGVAAEVPPWSAQG